MMFRKIWSGRIDSTSAGGELAYLLPPRAGGHMVKGANYQVKFVQKIGDTNLRIQLELQHGPDGTIAVAHSIPIPYAGGDPGATMPALLSGDADLTKIIGEYLHPILKIKANAGGALQAAVVEVFEMRKPF